MLIAVVYSMYEIYLVPSQSGLTGSSGQSARARLVRRFLSWRMLHLILFRLSFDVLLGILAFWLVVYPAFRSPVDVTALAPGIVAGLLGPGVFRTKLFSHDYLAVDIEGRYRKLVRFVDVRIADRSAAQQTTWLWTKALPGISSLTTGQLAQRATSYGRNRHQQGLLGLEALHAFERDVERIAEDNGGGEEARVTLLQLLVNLEGRDFVRQLIRNPS